MVAIPRSTPAVIAWIGIAAHLAVGGVGIATRRTAGPLVHPLPSPWPLLPLLNLAVVACVLAYWAREWYSYLARGITWYASDQAVPLYAACVAVAAGLALVGRFDGRVGQSIQWIAFGVDAFVLAGAAFYLTFMRINRLF